ncbi:MAG: hypothetical protein ACRESZ_02955 [Methylococcales bacterium]
MNEILMYIAWFALSLLFVTAGYCFEHEWQSPLLSHISTELGIAGMIAVMLALTIEHVSKKRDEQRLEADRRVIKNDVFEHVLGYRLPDGTFAAINDQILNAWFIRKAFTTSYRLSQLETDKGYILINGQLSYELFNMTPETKAYKFWTAIERHQSKG